MRATTIMAQGEVVNSFEELEPDYLLEYKKLENKVWCIGPVSLCNKDMSNNLCHFSTSQLIEIGLGLEASNRPFAWIIRQSDCSFELEERLLEERYEERIRGRGLIIRGWAPQVLILSHPAVGGFLTHCGWNSTVEGICSGVPMITWQGVLPYDIVDPRCHEPSQSKWTNQRNSIVASRDGLCN
ncbi:UDP-glycosyltransferase 73C3 [Vitis vinifera]|uniref:UDP-glycosyltransferase 73C3 n=1 Tax=Vitis vinifera TaxID=29760 RepID=A0A438EJR7_VITVI|nr:UDP-glycosyltransferase 73C3 [Vitis vinifera]